MTKWLRKAILAAAVLWAVPASADSWIPPQRETYKSADSNVRFTVIPRGLKDQLAYFTDKVKGKEPAGQRQGAQPYARGVLERRSGKSWIKVWDMHLVNEVSPVNALVANDGRYVVTFDNWHSVGFGGNVAVIYRANGTVVRSLGLADIVPVDYVRALPRSVSSIWWSGKNFLSPDGKSVILKVIIPGSSDSVERARGYFEVSVDLATGTVAPIAGPNWELAKVVAAPLIASAKAGESEYRARTIAPLQAPASSDDYEWTRYMYQAVDRLASPPSEGMGIGTEWVLPAVSDPSFAGQAAEIRAIFAETNEKDDFQFSSPRAPEALARVLIEGATSGVPGSLTGSRLFIALPTQLAEPVRNGLKRTGATAIVFDPAQPIPQRPEVLKELGVAPGQIAAEVAKAETAARRYKADADRLKALVPPEPKVAKPQEDDALMEEMAASMEAEADKLEKQE